MSLPARLIVDPPEPGIQNMARDQALLDECRDRPVLRLYQWAQPTLSLGYFQKHQQRDNHAPSLDCPMLRRSTGGGAILHDHELTYSLLVPQAQIPKRSADLYDVVHQGFCNWLEQQGLTAHCFADHLLWPDVTVNQRAFLCFQRRAEGDVVAWSPTAGNVPYRVAGNKLLGSAQRKQKNALLQHGSLLLKKSNHAPELPGIVDLPGYQGPKDLTTLAGTLRTLLVDHLSRQMSWQFTQSQPTESELQRSGFWQEERFSNPAWNQSR